MLSRKELRSLSPTQSATDAALNLLHAECERIAVSVCTIAGERCKLARRSIQPADLLQALCEQPQYSWLADMGIEWQSETGERILLASPPATEVECITSMVHPLLLLPGPSEPSLNDAFLAPPDDPAVPPP
uniref:Uncharacterized protein n=1 Tax=Coccolithus braarudii TaxID=221442 RepID=A0A7S0LIB0_9EUKA|mmetsp:Transcript_3772/g.8156  ORF Transcript_3772/g.8156 Transcript_3772/m.8156 type:complete len:131 (+) Transcript_3772:78-470(+)